MWLGVNQLNQRAQRFYTKQGFTINGARNKLDARGAVIEEDAGATQLPGEPLGEGISPPGSAASSPSPSPSPQGGATVDVAQLRKDVLGIIELLRR